MPIQVQFGKNGFHHPAFGRLGRGKTISTIYTLPDDFAQKGMLPRSAQIIDPEDLEDKLEEAEQAKPVKPKVADEAALKKAQARAAEVPKAKGGSTRKA
jgi:hypothetical protein